MTDPDDHNQAAYKKSYINRREFITRMGLLGALALNYPATALADLRLSRTKQALTDWQKQPTWQTIMQVQEVLLPAADDVPGAADIGASIYLHSAIENSRADAEDKDFIIRGVGWLDGMTQERHEKTFLQLTVIQQNEIIEAITKSKAGRNWVSTLLTYILEALLSDPIYGGNKNAIGWKWLEHQPGYPAPPADKTWDQLLQRRYKI